MRRLLWLPLLLVAGCAPELLDEYACANSASCPTDYSCWADGVCRRATPIRTNEECRTDEECTGRACALPLDMMAPMDAQGYCSFPCTEDAECDGLLRDGAGRCIENVCRFPCMANLECPEMLDCRVSLSMPMSGARLPQGGFCDRQYNMTLDGTRYCESNPPEDMFGCNLPGWCVQRGGTEGLCSMVCETRMGSQQCPRDSTCAAMIPGFGMCMIDCTSDATVCDAALTCVPHGDGNSYCMPPAWATMDTLPASTGNLPDLLGMETPMMPPDMADPMP